MSVKNDQYPKVLESISNTGAQFPEFLALNFPRILQRVELLWGTQKAVDYLDSLFLGLLTDDKKDRSYRADQSDMAPSSDRSNRQGFPVDAVKDIVLLKQVHQLQFPSAIFDLHDPFSGSEIVPIEKSVMSETSSEKIVSAEKNSHSVFAKMGQANTVMKRQIEWPVIHTQHELTQYAMLQLEGVNIYPLQGNPIGEILMHYGILDEKNLDVARAIHKRPKYKDRPIGELFVEIGLLKQDELIRTLFNSGWNPDGGYAVY